MEEQVLNTGEKQKLVWNQTQEITLRIQKIFTAAWDARANDEGYLWKKHIDTLYGDCMSKLVKDKEGNYETIQELLEYRKAVEREMLEVNVNPALKYQSVKMTEQMYKALEEYEIIVRKTLDELGLYLDYKTVHDFDFGGS